MLRFFSPLPRSPAVVKVSKPRKGHPLVEVVIVLWIVGKEKVKTGDWEIRRPRVLRTVKPLFRLPRGSTLRSLRERVEFLKLACLHLDLGTAYYRAA